MSRHFDNTSAAVQKHSDRKEPRSSRFPSAVRGIVSGLSQQGEPLVDFCGNTAGHPIAAISTIPVRVEDAGKEAILLFEDADLARPLLVGLVLPPAPVQDACAFDVKFDGRSLALSAERDISIRCGEASITLTRAGKVTIKGASLLSKSTGPNRIKGGSIQLN